MYITLMVPSESSGVLKLDALQDVCEQLMPYLREYVGLAVVDQDEWHQITYNGNFYDMMAVGHTHNFGERRKVTLVWNNDVLPRANAAPMAAAPFQYLDDGRPNWGAMWEGFCELALHGGPPHRGEDQALPAPSIDEDDIVTDSMVDEICRGIAETTCLTAIPSPGGWLAIQCSSRKMAAWLCATIVLENVEARFEDRWLFVPGDTGYDLKNQVKSVVTVVAKTHHYWQQHVASQSDALGSTR
jgi:sirohydrochlorin cobaltochelatase